MKDAFPNRKSLKQGQQSPKQEVEQLNSKHSKGVYALSKTPRMLPFAPGVSGYMFPSNFYNPGPGAYTEQPRAGRAFASSKSQRRVFDSSRKDEPGPGSYTYALPSRTGSSWAFLSRQERFKARAQDSIGPGSYDIDISPKVPARKAPSCDNPRLRAEASDVPGVGTYCTKEEIDKHKELLKKFVNFEVPTKKPPFNSTEEKTTYLTTSDSPGPGNYELSQQTGKQSQPFSTAPRFTYAKTETKLGPGTYDENKASAQIYSSHFKSKTPRFQAAAGSNPSVALVGEKVTTAHYLGHSAWGSKSVANCKKVSFESSALRRSEFYKSSQTPGPGSYRVKTASTSSVPRTTSRRFDSHGGYHPPASTSRELGPGKYLKQNSLLNKSFNRLGESSRKKPWLI